MERSALQEGAVDWGCDRDPRDARRGIPARGGEGGAEAHVCDEDTDAATVRKFSERGLHVLIRVHKGLKARRGITAGQGGGEGIDTALDHTHSNARNALKLQPLPREW